MAASTIRQRRRRDDEEENANGVNNNNRNSYDDIEMMEIFAKHYNNATKHSRGIFGASSQCRFLALLLLFFTTIISTAIIIIQYRSSSHHDNTLIRKDLKLITFYPHSLPHNLIHEMNGQTELLITNDNRNVVNAIRTSIGMANNLLLVQYNKNNNNQGRRRKKGGIVGVLLGISNFIANLIEEESSSSSSMKEEASIIPGDVILEAFDKVKIRNYLVKYGGKCSSYHDHQDNEHEEDDEDTYNTILLRYDELHTLMKEKATVDDNALLDALWNRIIQLFTWCQFVNEDAQGYIAFDTSIIGKDSTLQATLEEARVNGVGIAMKYQSHNGDNNDDNISQHLMADDEGGIHYSPLLVLPHCDSSSTDIAREILHSQLLQQIPTINNTTKQQHSNPLLLFEYTNGQIQKWSSMNEENKVWYII